MTERIKGVIYDAGTVFVPHLATTRRHLDEPAMRRELEVIRDELNASHVRVTASDPDRLDMVGAAVLEAGLGLWYSPAVFGYRPSETAPGGSKGWRATPNGCRPATDARSPSWPAAS